MSRIFWDTMLFIYLLEGNDAPTRRVEEILAKSRDRGDSLFTSHLALGEILAGAQKANHPEKASIIREVIQEMGFSFLPFDGGAVGPFSKLRALHKVKIADSIHLACAASASIDLFLTRDKDLTKLHVPGIQFIADFHTPLL